MEVVDYRNLEHQFCREESIEFAEPVILDFSQTDKLVSVYTRFKIDEFTRLERFICTFRGHGRIAGVVAARKWDSSIEVFVEVDR